MPPHALRDYALLADGERGAVVGPRGEIVWMCAPRWECDAVFASLVGGEGLYAVTPRARFVWGGYYEEGTLIWRSRWVTGEGLIECREALAFPGDPHRTVLLRRVIAGHSRARVQVRLDPRAEFGRKSLRSLRHGHGWWAGRLGDLYLRWSGDLSGARALRPAGDPSFCWIWPCPQERVLTWCLSYPTSRLSGSRRTLTPPGKRQKPPGCRTSRDWTASPLSVTPGMLTRCCGA